MHRATPQNRVLFARSPKSFGLGEFVVLCLTVFALVLAFVGPANRTYAATNPTINFQARLMNANGSVVADGNYNIEFKLYSASTGGSALWTEDWLNSSSQGANVVNGYLTVNLGSITSFAGSSIPWGSPLWLTMNVGGTSVGSVVWDGEMSPRLALTAVPSALSLVSSNGTSGAVSTLGFVSPSASQTLLLPVGPNSTNYVCYQGDPSCSFAPGTSTSYIDNQTSLQTNANFNIQARSSTVAGTLEANGADILDLQNSSTQNVVAFSATGVITIAGGQTTDITTANSASGVANGITIAPGSSGGAASNGGTVTLRAGVGSGTGNGGLLTLQGGSGGTGAAAAGGNVQIQGGTALGTGVSNGGSVVLQGGTPSASGVEGQIQINGGLLYTTTTYSSGTTATITQSAVDSYTTILATATAGSLTFTVPSPTITTSGRMIVVSNAGTNSFILAGAGNSFTLNAGSSATLMWNGTAWTNAGVDASTLQTAYNNSIGGSTPMIQLNTTLNGMTIEANSGQGSNQNFLTLLSPTGVQEIGFGVSGTYFQKPKVDGLDFEIQQNNSGTVSTTKDVFSVDTTSTASIVNLGSTSSASGYNGATINIETTNSANGTVNIGGSSLGGSATQTINIGYTATNTGTTNVNIGAASPGAGSTTVRGAGGLTLTGGAASTWSTSAGALTIQGFAGLNLQTPATNTTSTNSSSITIQTGNATGTTSNSGSITIDVGTATGTAGAINIGTTSTIAHTINIASNGSAGVTQTVNIANASGSGNSIVNIGSSVGTGYVTIQAGSTTNGPNGGGINLIVTGPSGGGGGGLVLKTASNNLYDAFVIQNASSTQTLAFNTVTGEMTIGNMSTTSQIQGILTLADGNGGNDGNSINLETASLSGLGTNTSVTQLLPALNGTVIIAQSTTGTAESGNINISGTTVSGTAVQTPSLTSAAATALGITANAASTWQTSTGALTLQSGSGNIILNPAGGSTTASVQIGSGNGGAGSTTPDLLVLDDGSSGSSVPTEVNGALYYNVALKSFMCGENGAWMSCIGGLRFANTNQSSLPSTDTVSNTTTETNFNETYTIPANDCVQGRVYRITANGTFADASSTPTLAIRFKLGSTNIAASTATAASSSANTFTWTAQVDMTCTAAPATSALIEADGLLQSSATGGAWFFSPIANQAASVNTTTTEAVHVSAQWGTAATTDTITLRQLVVEAMGP
ncbi:MAG TPA: hypothetical protein VIM53_03600 [Candidatus Saccharimonadales bacterium]